MPSLVVNPGCRYREPRSTPLDQKRSAVGCGGAIGARLRTAVQLARANREAEVAVGPVAGALPEEDQCTTGDGADLALAGAGRRWRAGGGGVRHAQRLEVLEGVARTRRGLGDPVGEL